MSFNKLRIKKGTFRQIAQLLDVEKLSLVESWVGVDFKPKFLLGHQLTRVQRTSLSSFIKESARLEKLPKVSWTAISSSDLLVGLEQGLWWLDIEDDARFFDWKTEVLTKISRGKHYLDTALFFEVQGAFDGNGECDNFSGRVVVGGPNAKLVAENVLTRLHQRDRAVIAVIGVPGTGKSTLVNQITGKRDALTGEGTDVTKNIYWHVTEDGKWAFIDFPGVKKTWTLEKAVEQLASYISEAKASNHGFQIDAIWYCIRYDGDRTAQKNEKILVKTAESLGIPLVAVLTRSPQGINKNDEMLKQSKKLGASQIVAINALETNGWGEVLEPAFGIPRLLEVTRRLVRLH